MTANWEEWKHASNPYCGFVLGMIYTIVLLVGESDETTSKSKFK
jgi:hypothetical protein